MQLLIVDEHVFFSILKEAKRIILIIVIYCIAAKVVNRFFRTIVRNYVSRTTIYVWYLVGIKFFWSLHPSIFAWHSVGYEIPIKYLFNILLDSLSPEGLRYGNVGCKELL